MTLDQIVKAGLKDADLLERSQAPDFNVHDWSGGNLTDAFELGKRAGYAEAAKDLSKALKPQPVEQMPRVRSGWVPEQDMRN